MRERLRETCVESEVLTALEGSYRVHASLLVCGVTAKVEFSRWAARWFVSGVGVVKDMVTGLLREKYVFTVCMSGAIGWMFADGRLQIS